MKLFYVFRDEVYFKKTGYTSITLVKIVFFFNYLKQHL